MWILIIAVGLILLFIFGLTHKPRFKLHAIRWPKKGKENLPWGMQQYGVGEEVLVPFKAQPQKEALFYKMLSRMGWEPIEEEFANALLFGLEIALQSDDYASAGIEFEDPELVARQLAKIEFELFDAEIYQQYNFYSHALIVLQDMLEEQANPTEKETILAAIENYHQKIKEIEPRLKSKFTGQTINELGSRKDREIYYFKMGITNYLRGKNIIPEFDRLYRIYGVNYQVDQAFQLITQKFPIFKKALTIGLKQITSWSLFELQQFVKNEAGITLQQKKSDRLSNGTN